MKRACPAIVIPMMCLLLPLCALAEGLVPAQAISGEREGLRYAVPQFVAATETDERINEALRLMADELPERLLSQSDMPLDGMEDSGAPGEILLDHEVTRNDERYLSVLLTAQQFAGNGVSESLYAATFARDGLYAGQQLDLSQVLGLEQNEADATDQEKAEPSLAAQLAYRLIWDIVRVEMENVDGDYLDGIHEETLMRALDPETDFYLDADGNVVFFIRSGILTGEIAGTLRFPFAPEEMLSAVME